MYDGVCSHQQEARDGHLALSQTVTFLAGVSATTLQYSTPNSETIIRSVRAQFQSHRPGLRFGDVPSLLLHSAQILCFSPVERDLSLATLSQASQDY